MTKYIDAEKLKTEIERRINLLSQGDAHPEVMNRVEGVLKGYNSILNFIDSLQQEQPSLSSNLDEAAFTYEDSSEYPPANEEEERMVYDAFKAGAELILSELFEKLNITPLKVIGKDESGYPVYDFEVGHYYRTFTLFGEKYKCDQTDSGEAGEQMMAGQGYTTEETVDRTPLNGPAGICMNLHEYDGFKLGDRVIVQIRKKD